MNTMPESAAALPPAIQYVTPTQARSRKNVACTYRPMPATVASFQDHFISPGTLALVARPRPRHEVKSFERDRLPAALAPPVLVRSLVQPLERGFDLGKLGRLARGVHGLQLLVRGVRPLVGHMHGKGGEVSRLLLQRFAGCAIVTRQRVHDPRSLLQQSSLQVLPLCRGQGHTPSPCEIAARRASRKQGDVTKG